MRFRIEWKCCGVGGGFNDYGARIVDTLAPEVLRTKNHGVMEHPDREYVTTSEFVTRLTKYATDEIREHFKRAKHRNVVDMSEEEMGLDFNTSCLAPKATLMCALLNQHEVDLAEALEL